MPNQQFMFQGVILVAFILIMYFMLIRPQKKKEQEVEDMRNSIRVGDHVVTIGGIVGKVVKVKEDGFIIQVGADKTKFEIKRWAVSTVEKDKRSTSGKAEIPEEVNKPKPKRLGKKGAEAEEETVLIAKEEVAEEANIPEVVEALPEVEAVAEAAAEAVEETVNE